MIYIDPPYNTKSNHLMYLDDFKQLDKSNKPINDSHSTWLTFMYPRLFVARKLLRKNGVIFISIGDNELAQLKLVCDEIFKEKNFVIIIPRITKRTGNRGTYFKNTKDYLLVYAKNIDKLAGFGIKNKLN